MKNIKVLAISTALSASLLLPAMAEAPHLIGPSGRTASAHLS